jgi:hypothetical protein
MSRPVVLLALALLIGGCGFPLLDRANPDPKLPPYPVRLNPIGRFMLPVPKGMEVMGTTFKVNDIKIKEIPWKSGVDREEYFRGIWMPVRTEARENYEEAASVGPYTQGGWAEKDISELLGHPAMLLCYKDRQAEHEIDIHIGLPELVLRLTESRFYDIGVECRDMEGRIHELLKHYRYGSRNVHPDSFFSAAGRIEGMKTWHEQAGIGFNCPTSGSSNIRLFFDTYPSGSPDEPKSILTIMPLVIKYGTKLHVLRSSKRVLAGMEGLEEVYLGGNKEDEELELTASWKFQGAQKDPLKPMMEIELTSPESAKDEALRMWDALMKNFTSVREYYGDRTQR